MARVVPLTAPFAAELGHAFTATLPDEVHAYARDGALAFVFEDGRALSPGDSLHDDVRHHGRGAYRLWGSRLYFSASDNSDCNANQRTYSLVLVSLSPASQAYAEVLGGLAKDDELLMASVARNSGHNKSLTLNFLQYYAFFHQFLERYGVTRPDSVLELGPGERPYTALRFLIEGATRCVVNDIAPMQRAFTPDFLDHLGTFVDLVWPGRGNRLHNLRRPPDARGLVSIKGLEICDDRPFEELDIEGDFDLVHSVSVLEHVMNPGRVVAKTRDLLKPGGYACHSIDLRDHANFADPLGFLRLSEDDYAPTKSENRLRASDWFALFEAHGLELIGRELVTYRSAADHEYVYSESAGAYEPWVTDAMRQEFATPFHTKDLDDLSIVGVRVLYRKPL